MDNKKDADAIAVQLCRSAGLDTATALALIWRIRGWVQNADAAKEQS